MTNAMGLLLIRAGLKLVKDGNNKAAHETAEKFVTQLNDTSITMSKWERRYKQAFVRTHGLIDKVLNVIPDFDTIEKAIPK